MSELPRCSFDEPERDSRKNGDPINLTPYIWTALKYSGLTDEDLVEFGISVDRSMSINLSRALTGLVEQRKTLRAQSDPSLRHELHAQQSAVRESAAQPSPLAIAQREINALQGALHKEAHDAEVWKQLYVSADRNLHAAQVTNAQLRQSLAEAKALIQGQIAGEQP